MRGQTRCRGIPRLITGRSQVWSRPGRQRCRGRGCMRCRAIPRFEFGYAHLRSRPGRQRRRGRGRGRGRGNLPGQQRHRAGVAPSGGASRARVASRARSVRRACGRYARLHARARVEVGRPAWRARCAPSKIRLLGSVIGSGYRPPQIPCARIGQSYALQKPIRASRAFGRAVH